MSGTFRVYGPTNDGNQYVDITGIRVAGDLTIVANGPITADQGSADVTVLNNDDKLMVLVSYYQPPAGAAACARTAATRATARSASRTTSGLEQHGDPRLRAERPDRLQEQRRVLRSRVRSNIVMKNNQVTTYDAHVEQIVGFGPVTLEQESWQELTD